MLDIPVISMCWFVDVYLCCAEWERWCGVGKLSAVSLLCRIPLRFKEVQYNYARIRNVQKTFKRFVRV